MNTTPLSLGILAFGLFAFAYVLEDKGAILSTAASAMALVINGAAK